MRILAFGGSFDPPHLGHEALLKAAAKTLRPDRILVVPAYQAPMKEAPGAPARDRAAMARLSLAEGLGASWRGRARLELSELKSGRPVYTVETLRRLKARWPGAELHFAVGSDSAASFSAWREPAALRRLSRWWTAARPGSGRPPSFFGRLPGRMPDVSSTEVRRRLALGEGTAGLLRPAVAAYIARRGLYGAGLLAALARGLSPERYAHTLAVARQAESLARRWDEDPRRALLAGLLHDLGRSIPVPRMARYALSRRLPVPALRETAARAPLLLHAHISADLARRRFGVADEGVLAAVSLHTLGRARMSRLDKVLYVADSCSADRSYPGVAALRRLAASDLDEAFAACARNKICDALARGAWLHPSTLSLWNSLSA